jgi:hypothetical protein
MHPLLESLRGALPDTCENYWHLRSVSGEPTEQDLQTRGQFYTCGEPQAGNIGDVEQFQPPPDQPPLREERAPALVLGEVELRGAADHMQARLQVPPDGGRDARTPVPYQRRRRELHLRACKERNIGVQHGQAQRLSPRHPRPQPTGLVKTDSAHHSIFWSAEAKLQLQAEAPLPHSKFRRTAEKFADRRQEYPQRRRTTWAEVYPCEG